MISNEEAIALVRKNPIATGCLAAALLLGAGIYWRSEAVPAQQAELEQKSVEGRRIARNVRYAAQLPEQLTAMNEAVAAIEPRLVRADELANNLQYFYKLEAETGVKLTDLRQLAPPAAGRAGKAATPAAAFGAVGFTVSLQGEYMALLDFLRRLENGVHYSRVTLASASVISPDRTGPLSLQLTVELLSHR